MLNQFILVGVVKKPPQTRASPNGISSSFVVEVKNSHSKFNDIDENDLFEILLFGNMMKTCEKLLAVGTVVGIKAILISTQNEKKSFHYEVCAQKISILSEREETN